MIIGLFCFVCALKMKIDEGKRMRRSCRDGKDSDLFGRLCGNVQMVLMLFRGKI